MLRTALRRYAIRLIMLALAELALLIGGVVAVLIA